MRSNRIIESCLVAITILLAFAVLRPVFWPGTTRAQSHYEYQLVQTEENGSSPPAETFSKLTKQGWEPVGMSCYYYQRGICYLLFRR